MRAIAVVKQLVLPNDPGDVGVPGHQPERVKAFDFDSTERLIGAKPAKSAEKRFLSRIGFRRGNEVSEALRHFFSVRHSPSSLRISWSRVRGNLSYKSAAC